ncbi:MAG TPA: EAL domain-containing protein [Allosphingosinicella sp.]|nr:EAL domain-containing protein [Allosphingosinicella sp.]
MKRVIRKCIEALLAPVLRPLVTAAEARARLAQERLRSAIDAFPEGIVFLDPDGRYILWNQKYAEIYHRSSDLFAPGARLEDTLRVGIARGDYPEAAGREETWLKERMALLANPGTRHEQRLSNGRCIMVEERRTADDCTIGLRVDITEMKRREESFRLLFEANPVPLFVCEGDNIVSANEAAARYYGYAADGLGFDSVEQLFHVDDWHDARRAIVGGCVPPDRIWRQQRSDGTQLESILFTREIEHEGRPATLVGVFDVTERRRAEARVEYMARHDELTGLPNRAYCREALAAMMAGLEAKGGSVAVLMIDLDHFKDVNDSLGHSIGDALLAAAAKRMLGLAPADVMVARIGGDEFAMLVPFDCGGERAFEMAARLVEEMAKPFKIEAHGLTIGATVGIALAPVDSAEPESLVKFADLALYSAKQEGRSAWRRFTPEMDVAAQDRRRLENDLRRAIRNGELVIHYQPLIDLQSGRTDGYEALLRWHHPERGLVPPSEFIPFAEEIGLIDTIGSHVLQTACRQAALWPDATKLAVNISPLQFRDSRVLQMTAQALATSGLDPTRLELEITEAVLMQKKEGVIATLNGLRALGVGIAMDDFGTGYSSLSYLLSFPFSKIKIDRSFVDELDQRPESQAIVRAIIGLGVSLGMAVTAEGIEQASVLEYLKTAGCPQGQGYLFARAAPADELPDAEDGKRAAA